MNPVSVPTLDYESKIYVNVKTYGWIAAIRRQGPLPSLLVPIHSIIDMINQGVKVEVSKNLWPAIYNLILIFNKDAEINKTEQVVVAQKHFEDLMNIERKKEETLEIAQRIKTNPFERSKYTKELEQSTKKIAHIPKNEARRLKEQMTKSKMPQEQMPISTNKNMEEFIDAQRMRQLNAITDFGLDRLPDVELDLSDIL